MQWSDRLEFTLTVEFGAARASLIHAEVLPESCHDHAALHLANLLDDKGDFCYPLAEEEAERPTVAFVFRDDAARATERVRAAADSAGLAVRTTPPTTADDDDDDDGRAWLLPHAERCCTPHAAARRRTLLHAAARCRTSPHAATRCRSLPQAAHTPHAARAPPHR